jgi:hypothetical protein
MTDLKALLLRAAQRLEDVGEWDFRGVAVRQEYGKEEWDRLISELRKAADTMNETRAFARVVDAITDSPEEADALQRQYDARALRSRNVPASSRDELTRMVDAAMVEMSNIHPPLRRSECERLIQAALGVDVSREGQQ